MPNLLGTKNDATSVPLILKRHGDNAIAFAEDVKAGSTIPNSTNNDLDAWITYLSRNSGGGGSGITVVSTLPTDLSSYSVGDAIILSEQDGDNAKGVYIVAADSSDVYYQGRIRHYDSNGDRIISSFDPNPQNSLTFIEWYSNSYGDHRGQILLGIKSKLFDSRPNHIYLRVTHKNGTELASSIDITFSHNGNQSLGTWIYWTTDTGIADNFDTGDTMRFGLYSDVGFQNALVPRSNKFWEDVAIDFGEGGSLVELIQSIEQLANANKLEADTNRTLIDQLQGESQGDLNWVALSRVEIDAGVGYFQQDSNTTESVYDSEFTTIAQQIGSGQYRFYLRVPRDVDPTKYRIENVNASDNSLIRSLPGSGQEWHEMTTVRNASSAYKYYRLYSTDTSLVQRVINQQIGNNTGIRIRSATRVGALAIPLGALAQSGATAGQVPQWNATDNEWEAGTIESAARGALSLTQIGGTVALSGSNVNPVDSGIAVSDLSDAFYMSFNYTTGGTSRLNNTMLILKSQIGASRSSTTRIQLQGAGAGHVQIYRSNGNLFFLGLSSAYSEATVRIFNTLAGARGEPGAVTDLGEVIHVVDSLPAAPYTGYSAGQQVEVNGTIYELSDADTNIIKGISSDQNYLIGTFFERNLGMITPLTTLANHVSGRFTHNPVDANDHVIVGAFNFIIDQSSRQDIEFAPVAYILKSAYETAKGSAVAANDPCTFLLDYDDPSNNNNDVTSQITMLHSIGDGITASDGTEYLAFTTQISVTENARENSRDTVNAAIAGLETTHLQYFNAIKALERSAANDREVSLSFYAAATQTNRITGLATTGWTPKYSSLSLDNKALINRNRGDIDTNTQRVDNILSTAGPISLISNKISGINNRILDLNEGTGVPISFAKVGAVTDTNNNTQKRKPAIAALNTSLYRGGTQYNFSTALGIIRGLSNTRWENEFVYTNGGVTQYIAVRIPRGTGSANSVASNYRLKFLHSVLDPDSNNSFITTASYIPLDHLWYAGNGTSPDVAYWTLTTPIVDIYTSSIELQYVSGTSHVGQTEFSGKFDGSFVLSTAPDLSGSIVSITQTQYDALTTQQKTSGKLFAVEGLIYINDVNIL